MFGIGMPELILIMAVALIVIGPKKLPDLAKSLGRALGEFKKATRDFKETIEIDHDMGDLKKAFQDVSQDIQETAYMPDDTGANGQKPEEASEKDKQDTGVDAEKVKGSDHDS
jgi:sec-independent protein translocase protein TatB